MRKYFQFTFLFFLLCNIAVAKTPPSSEPSLKKEIPTIFNNCTHSRKDFLLKLEQLKSAGEHWFSKLNKDEIKKHLFEPTLEGQMLTLVIPYLISEEITFAKVAKSCWADYEEWRRNYEKLKNDPQEKSNYKIWQQCVKRIYSEKLEVMDLIESCRPKSN